MHGRIRRDTIDRGHIHRLVSLVFRFQGVHIRHPECFRRLGVRPQRHPIEQRTELRLVLPLVLELCMQSRSAGTLVNHDDHVSVHRLLASSPIRGEDGDDSLVRQQEFAGLDRAGGFQSEARIGKLHDLDRSDIIGGVQVVFTLSCLIEEVEKVVAPGGCFFQASCGGERSFESVDIGGVPYDNIVVGGLCPFPVSHAVIALGLEGTSFFVQTDHSSVVAGSQLGRLKTLLNQIERPGSIIESGWVALQDEVVCAATQVELIEVWVLWEVDETGRAVLFGE